MTNDPIGRMRFDPQQCRDAAAGPPVGGKPKAASSDWPKPLSENRRKRLGPKEFWFVCDCGQELATIGRLITHIVTEHRRHPTDLERTPHLPPPKPRGG